MKKHFSLFCAVLVASSAVFASSFERVTDAATLLAGGTFIIGYEKYAHSHRIIPMRTEGSASLTKQGYLYAGMTAENSQSDTLDMKKLTTTSDYEVEITSSTVVNGAINILVNGNYVGNENAKNALKLYSEEGVHTAFTPTLENNDVFRLVIAANETYHTLQYNYAKPRFACYENSQKNVVFYKKVAAAAPVATPVFNPSMPDFAQSVNITLSCDTKDAAIYYTLDGSTPSATSTVYTEPIALNATTTVSAVAIKDGISSEIITRKYTKHALSTCSDANASASNTLVFLDVFSVAYVSGEYVFVQDATGSTLLYGGSTAELGMVSGNRIQGFYGVCGKHYIVSACTASDLSVTSGTPPSPIMLNAAPTTEDINKYVRFTGIATTSMTFSQDADALALTIGDETTTLRNTFGKAFAFEEGTIYDIVGVVSLGDDDTVEIFFISAVRNGETSVDSVSTDVQPRARKIFRRGCVSIVRDGIEHSVTGSRIK